MAQYALVTYLTMTIYHTIQSIPSFVDAIRLYLPIASETRHRQIDIDLSDQKRSVT
jgi:hypothetical protein